jgi:hypothetical protein
VFAQWIGRDMFASLGGACRVAGGRGREVHTVRVDCRHVLVSLLQMGVAGGEAAPLDRVRQLQQRLAFLSATVTLHPAQTDSLVHPDEFGFEVDASLREAVWRAYGMGRIRACEDPLGFWSACARSSLAQAMRRAIALDVGPAGPIELLEAVVDSPCGHARRLLTMSGLPPEKVLRAARTNAGRLTAERPRTPLLEAIRWSDVVVGDPAPWWERAGVRLVLLGRRIEPLLLGLELEANRQAIRVNSRYVNTAHLLLAVLELEEQLKIAGVSLRDSVESTSRGGRLLVAHGVTSWSVVTCLPEIAADDPAVRPPTRRRFWRGGTRGPSWARSAWLAAEVPWQRSSLRTVKGSTDLLASIVENPDSEACRVLNAIGVDVDTLMAQASRTSPP